MEEPIEELYFNWLSAKVLTTEYPIYYDLMLILYRTEFAFVVGGDRNRVQDGLELKEDFLRETGYHNDLDWFNQPCSILEMLIALAKRAQFQTDWPVKKWFWIFLENLGLEDYRRVAERDIPQIESMLATFVNRQYERGGYGGLFPMRWSSKDQREVEIWYQLFDWLGEQAPI